MSDSPQSPAESATAERLAGAARELFGRDGFNATTLDAVVSACGVTKGSFYHHFKGKTELFEAVFEREAARMFELISHAVGRTPDLWEGAHAGVRAYLDHAQDPVTQRVVLVDAPSVLGWERVREIESQYGLALIKASLQALADAQLIRGHDVEPLAHLLFGALTEGALYMAKARDQAAARDKIEREARALLDGLAATRS